MGAYSNQDLVWCVKIGYMGVHSNEDLIWCVKMGVYMAFCLHRGS